MKYASRINSFHGEQNDDLIDMLKKISDIDGITHVDLNYPEHFVNHSIEEIRKALMDNNLILNGIATRFRNDFINGEFTNLEKETAGKAIALCKESVDICRQLGGQVVTVWLGYDGYDYTFQMNYEKAWDNAVSAFKEICEYGKDIRISIEYKPYQPRVFSLIASFGDTMMMINDVGADNIGCTLDFCHMLMKGENPSFGLSLACNRDKLMGIHLNDGNKLNDDGLMVGTINFAQTLEFIFYLKKYNYNEVIYFDTFPIREEASFECEANIKMTNKISALIDKIGMDEIQKIIDKGDGIAAQRLIMDFIA